MKLHLLDLGHSPIYEQLEIEEALLRTNEENFCIINRGSSRAIVMGISGDPTQLLDIHKVKQDQIPVIKRFSGGGTVIVDDETLFITFLFSKDTLPIAPYPEPILRWSGDLYTKSWNIPHFHLIENDYAIGPKKCGGNAQYLKKDRWLHHTSFLWDYSPHNMDYLLLPMKRPRYRESRSHDEFLCKLKDHAPSKETLIDQLKKQLGKEFILMEFHKPTGAWPEHRKALQRLSI
jgi:lipoate-protein ligase A